jgi:hypothetical protein
MDQKKKSEEVKRRVARVFAYKEEQLSMKGRDGTNQFNQEE